MTKSLTLGFSIALFLYFILFRVVPVSVATVSIPIPNDKLEQQVQDLRNENYQIAIKTAEDAGNKADRFLSTMGIIATIYGVLFAAITLFAGGNVIAAVRDLRVYGKSAKKNAVETEKIYKKAASIFSDLKKKEKDTTGSKKTQRQLESILGEAKNELSQIQSLKSSAAFISNATPSYPSIGSGYAGSGGGGGATGPSGPYISAAGGVGIGYMTCSKCGQFKNDSEFDQMEQYTILPVCKECRKKGFRGI